MVVDLTDPPAGHRRSALELLQACRTTDEQGYVQLQTIPYRGHHLLAQAVLDVTRPGDRVFEGGRLVGLLRRRCWRRRPGGRRPRARSAAAERGPPGVRARLRRRPQHLRPRRAPARLPGAAVRRHARAPGRPGGGRCAGCAPGWRPAAHLVAERAQHGQLGRAAGSAGRALRLRRPRHPGSHPPALLHPPHPRPDAGHAGFEVTRLVATVPVPAVHDDGAGPPGPRDRQPRPSLFAYTFVVTARAAGRS